MSVSLRRSAWAAISLIRVLGLAAQTPTPPYKDPRRPTAERVRDLLPRLTLDEKFWQLFMIPGDLDNPTYDYSPGIFGLQVPPSTDSSARAHAERINTIQRYFVERSRLGIPIIPFEEAVHGLARPGATVFPAAIALAATWDTALVRHVAEAIAMETRTRGIRQVLSPVVNIASDVRWGRVEETYGEDPVLSAAMARAFVGAFERAGIVTTPKHFVANVGEGGRDSYPIDWDRRRLEEIFFPPFRAALDAGARSVMTAYNSVDGVPGTQNRRLLTDVLKRDWRFRGFVISDAAATGGAVVLHHTEPNTPQAAADAWNAGLDVVFQSSYPQHRPYLDAVRRGLVSPAVLDSGVARVLCVKFDLGLFDHPYVSPDSAAAANGSVPHRELARQAARAAIVLLKNARQRLPLGTVSRIAVIGSDASEARLGGYSGSGVDRVSILAGIRERLGERATVRYAAGPGRFTAEYVTVPDEAIAGVRGEYFDNPRLAGTPALVRADSTVDFHWTFNSPGPGIAQDWFSARWTGRLTVGDRAVTRIGIEGNDGYRLYVDDSLVIDNWTKRSFGVRTVPLPLARRTTHDIRLEYFETAANARVTLIWDAGVTNDWQAQIDSAAAAARQSDVAIVVAGLEEGEFRDRAFLGLPGHQEELIRAVAATGMPVVVVLIGGSAITMPWLDQVDAVLDAWYPGDEGGRAVADVLFGDADPGGRLPITFPMAEGQLPLVYNHLPTGRGDDYLDLTGAPLFPFGYGLSYATFEYSGLTIEPAEIGRTGVATVRCRVKNTGALPGDEVVQLYVRDVLASVARPVIALQGFARVHLEPGEEREVTFRLGPEQLRLLDANLHSVVEPGAFRVLVGRSSVDIRLRGTLTVR